MSVFCKGLFTVSLQDGLQHGSFLSALWEFPSPSSTPNDTHMLWTADSLSESMTSPLHFKADHVQSALMYCSWSAGHNLIINEIYYFDLVFSNSKQTVHSKTNSLIIYSKPVWLSFFCKRQKDNFLIIYWLVFPPAITK